MLVIGSFPVSAMCFTLRTRSGIHPNRLSAAWSAFTSGARSPCSSVISRSSDSSAKLIGVLFTTRSITWMPFKIVRSARSSAMISPGSSCPVSFTSSRSIGIAPSSDARMSFPDRVSIHRRGRNPMRSSAPTRCLPSVASTAAGPSHAPSVPSARCTPW